jgi:Na+-translocating ferredoxin:NAD+ oxidoreductase RNF subunit RnfB
MDEYEAHIKDGVCPALDCKDFIEYTIDAEICDGCMVCLKSCPVSAITGFKDEIHVIDAETCVKCGTCLDLCKRKKNAVKLVDAK